MLTELLFPLALFDRRARRVLPLAGFGMQLGIGLVMNIWFTQFIAAYLIWVPWGCVADRLKGKNKDTTLRPDRSDPIRLDNRSPVPEKA